MSDNTILAQYSVATEGSMTRDGGKIRLGSHVGERISVDGIPFACVGDEIVYPDGKIALIDSGAGFAATFDEYPLALVGSTVDNGDIVINTLLPDALVISQTEEEPIPGLFEKGYRLPMNSEK